MPEEKEITSHDEYYVPDDKRIGEFKLYMPSSLDEKYGGYLRARRAARTIQLAYREYKLRKNYLKLCENSLKRRSYMSKEALTSGVDVASADFEHLVEKFSDFELDLSVKESICLKNSITPNESDAELDTAGIKEAPSIEPTIPKQKQHEKLAHSFKPSKIGSLSCSPKSYKSPSSLLGMDVCKSNGSAYSDYSSLTVGSSSSSILIRPMKENGSGKRLSKKEASRSRMSPVHFQNSDSSSKIIRSKSQNSHQHQQQQQKTSPDCQEKQYRIINKTMSGKDYDLNKHKYLVGLNLFNR